jgi:hypothetical protein
MTRSVDVLLRKIDDGVAKVRAEYEANLAAKEVSDELLYEVRHVILDCHSALGHTATAVKDKYFPAGKWDPYFPVWDTPERFTAGIDRQIPGLRTNHPKVAAAFERHQPYQPEHAELGYLPMLNRVNDHRDFTPQERSEQRTTRFEFPGGAMIEMGEGASITMGPGADIRGGGTSIREVQPKQMVYIDWLFVDPPVSVLGTLEALARLVRATVQDIHREASL